MVLGQGGAAGAVVVVSRHLAPGGPAVWACGSRKHGREGCRACVLDLSNPKPLVDGTWPWMHSQCTIWLQPSTLPPWLVRCRACP